MLRIENIPSGNYEERGHQREERLEGEVQGTKLKWNRKLKIVKWSEMKNGKREEKWNEREGEVLNSMRESGKELEKKLEVPKWKFTTGAVLRQYSASSLPVLAQYSVPFGIRNVRNVKMLNSWRIKRMGNERKFEIGRYQKQK